MRSLNLRTLIVAAVAAFGLACADAPVEPRIDPTLASSRDRQGNRNRSCNLSLNDLVNQARGVLGARSGGFHAVRELLENMNHHRRAGRTKQVQRRAHQIVEIVLKLQAKGRISANPALVTAFINNVYCFAGIDIVVETPEDSWFILPSDEPQVLFGLDSSVGVSLPASVVSEPSILRIERIDGRLNTRLDQYPGFVRISLLNDGGTALTSPVTITVCAVGAPSPEVANRLRLGHGINETGFVITPEPTTSDPAPANVACDPAAPGLFGRAMHAVRSLFAPRTLEASSSVSVRRFGGGVSGTVTEFSPFAPVDPILSFGGGVSGTVTEFSRDAIMMAVESAESADCQNVPVGTNLPPACQPTVAVRTFNGTLLQNVPVDWTVNSDALGRIAPRSGNLTAITCGTLGTTAATATSANGNAGVCWQLGGVGVNTIVARARAGGDAPAGVTFVNGNTDVVTFNVNVTPVSLQVTQGQGMLIQNGTSTSAQVRAVDASGNPVAGVHVNWAATGGSVSPATAVTGADGLATVSWTMGLGSNTLTAAVRSAPSTAVQLFGVGKVTGSTAGLPSDIALVSGNGQSGPAGVPLASPLVVRVTDSAGVPVAGTPVRWLIPVGNGTLSALTTLTDANGIASVTFAPAAGTNTVGAYIELFTVDVVQFTSLTGVAP